MRTNIIGDFEKIAHTRTDCIAVDHNDDHITFSMLYQQSSAIGQVICERIGYKINAIIAVLLPKCVDAVVCNVAVTLSGNAFMNLDIMTPQDRIGKILENVQPSLIITDIQHREEVDCFNIPVITFERIELDQSYKCDNWKKTIDTDPFCVINTSGSTGTPKSVVLNHKSFLDFCDWAFESFNFDETEIIGSLSPLVFDIYVFELCLLLMKGSRISLLDSSLAAFPVKLVDRLNFSKITFIFWVPTIMVNIANMDLLSGREPNELRVVWFAGEVFPTKQFLYWYDKLPMTKFVNMYGPIEITLDCTYHLIEDRPSENDPLPIGIPCRNTDIILLNENNEEAKVGEEAELCVRGTSLAMGYYNNPEKTMQSFVQNPLNRSYPEIIYRTGDLVVKDSNGVLYIKGRKDSMIKHNGYRIELAEIEHIIVNQTNLVKNCCAVYNHSKKKIVLYYENDETISKADFRKELIDLLPKYMIPQEFVLVDELPRNTNGKIDRFRLFSETME